MFRYRLYTVDGSELGESVYAMQIHVGDVIHHGGTPRYRVLNALPAPDGSPLTGVLQVELAG